MSILILFIGGTLMSVLPIVGGTLMSTLILIIGGTLMSVLILIIRGTLMSVPILIHLPPLGIVIGGTLMSILILIHPPLLVIVIVRGVGIGIVGGEASSKRFIGKIVGAILQDCVFALTVAILLGGSLNRCVLVINALRESEAFRTFVFPNLAFLAMAFLPLALLRGMMQLEVTRRRRVVWKGTTPEKRLIV
jgi:hypothetical protein